jgi:hypothetical protein
MSDLGFFGDRDQPRERDLSRLARQPALNLRRASGLRQQFREGLGDVGEELLSLGFLIGGAALVVLVVAQGGLGVGVRTVQEVSLTGPGGFTPGGLGIDKGDV